MAGPRLVSFRVNAPSVTSHPIRFKRYGMRGRAAHEPPRRHRGLRRIGYADRTGRPLARPRLRLAVREGVVMKNPDRKDVAMDLIPLLGARMLRAAEPEQGSRLQERVIRELTQGRPLRVRTPAAGFVEVQPSQTLTVAEHRALPDHPGLRLVRRDTISAAGISRGEWLVEPADGSPCDTAFLQRAIAAILLKDADRGVAES